MKCLVFSDSHGATSAMRAALAANRDAEVIFFLGDGLTDAEALSLSEPNRAWICVRGNCDYASVFRGSEVKKAERICLEGFNIILTHGDVYGVKYGIGGVLKLLSDTGSDIILFGHTHTPFERYDTSLGRGVYLFNPGAAVDGSFGIMTLGKEPLFSHGNLF